MKTLMNNSFFAFCLAIVTLLAAPLAIAAADLEINTPAISAIQASMKSHHVELRPYYDNGAIGLTRDGLVAVHDATLVPLAQRQSVNALVAAQNKDRNALYKEIASANGHPEWEPENTQHFCPALDREGEKRLVVSGRQRVGEEVSLKENGYFMLNILFYGFDGLCISPTSGRFCSNGKMR